MHGKDRTLRVGDNVYVMSTAKTKWVHGVIVEQTSPVSFKVCLDDGRVVLRHVDHVRSRRVNDEKEEISVSEKKLPPGLSSELPPELPVKLPPQTQEPDMESPHTHNLRRSRKIRSEHENLNL